MVVFPHAKLNLGLHVGEQLTDGYHALETLLYPLPLYDVLEAVEASAQTTWTLSGLGSEALSAQGVQKNLAARAYALVAEDHPLPPLEIYLHKNIPAGAGLGGGSSDAAAMLLLLNTRFELALSDACLHDYACRLGSDVPFFLHTTPQLASGRGEQLTAWPQLLAGKHIWVLFPDGLHISTADAYTTLPPRPRHRPALEQLLVRPQAHWATELVNDFQAPLLLQHPALPPLFDALQQSGAWYVSLTGTGGACYGLYDTAPMASPPPNCWSFKTQFLETSTPQL